MPLKTEKLLQEKSETYQRLYKQFYEEAKMIVQSVLRRSLFLVQRYAQHRVNDLNDRGLKTEMISGIGDTDRGVRLTIEFIPDEECIVKAVKNRAFRKLIKRYEKEAKKMKRSMEDGSSKA